MAVTCVSCGIDSKFNELLNPPAKQTIPIASFTANNEKVKVGTPVFLDASSSHDPQGEALTYAWSLDVPTGSASKLSSATASTTSFTPDKGGYYVVSLVVTNVSTKKSVAATLQISSVGTGGNHPPVAITTAAVAITTGNAVVLDGSQSYDPDQEILYYTWILLGAPSTSVVTTLSDNTSKTAYFTPDVAGTYTVKLVVTDGLDSDQALVTVTVTAQTAISIPTASFTVDKKTVKVGTPVRLDATASSDPQGKTLTYAWSIHRPKGSSSALTSATTVVTSFTPDEGGEYLAYLKVTNSSSVASDTVEALVDAVGTGNNHPPVAITTAAVAGTIKTVVVLNGAQSYDADRDGMTYQWTLVGAPSASAVSALTDDTLQTAYFTPDVAGKYNVKFIVSDGIDSDEAFVVVTAK
jgi:hypothetical protein